MKKKLISDELEKLVKRAFAAKKEVCGQTQWSGFAAEVRRLSQAGTADQYLARAHADAEQALGLVAT